MIIISKQPSLLAGLLPSRAGKGLFRRLDQTCCGDLNAVATAADAASSLCRFLSGRRRRRLWRERRRRRHTRKRIKDGVSSVSVSVDFEP